MDENVYKKYEMKRKIPLERKTAFELNRIKKMGVYMFRLKNTRRRQGVVWVAKKENMQQIEFARKHNTWNE